MATSALISLANASVRFQVAGAGVVTDPETGNVTPTTAVVTCKAFLKAVNVDPVVYPGVDVTAVVYEGYVVEPMALDPKVGAGTTGELNFGSGGAQQFEVLRARMGYGDQGALGAPLSGVLGTKVTLLAQGG
jgi:hypothetical protein